MADLRFGTFLAPRLLSLYQAITDRVGERLGMTTELVVETDYENCRNDINDICFVCSLPYVMFEREGVSPATPIAAPVLAEPRYGGKPIYFSDVIVHRDSDITTFEDLRGRSWAYNEPLSHSGYGITRYHLVRLGETDGFFGDVIEAGFHEAAIGLVHGGEIEGSAIDSQVLGIELRDDPELRESLRIVATLGPSTIQPIAVSNRFPLDFHSEVRAALLDLHHDPGFETVLSDGMVDRFVEVGPESYDDIRSMLNACESADFMELR